MEIFELAHQFDLRLSGELKERYSNDAGEDSGQPSGQVVRRRSHPTLLWYYMISGNIGTNLN